MNISEKYIDVLGREKVNLENYLKGKIQEVELPEQIIISKRSDNQDSSSLKTAKTFLLVGGLGIISGLAFDKMLLVVTGIGAVGVGGMLLRKNNRAEADASQRSTQDYYQVTSKVYGALSSIQKHLFDAWDGCTTTIKSQIKSEINRLNVEDDVKNRAIQSILNTSIIEISMLNVSQALSKIEQMRDYDAYRQYLCSFEQNCLRAIQKAFDEQVNIYNNLKSIL